MSWWLWLAVAAIGGAGAVVRFVTDAVISGRFGRDFPLGTLAINLSGALVLGFLSGVGAVGELDLLAGTALIGSYTTFSTWMLESYRLAEDAEPWPAVVNAVASLLLGFAAALLGRAIGRSI
ncbi:fluoride efflux transporter CrcB [Conexibacter sp. S30A1]|uniref:fluoride efflux transporter CrcB n=1 Tax=Conexibacter sp. S30A1 TaxID=2937800 RepID=UPI00200C4298|nr:fluoride efflux transporter CrcB [Conexibacter sp. S30A1]